MKQNNQNYKICSRCILDTNDYPEISFDSNGVCNICNTYDNLANRTIYKGKEAEEKLSGIISKIKAKGKGGKYDCIIGISGGVDSTYLTYQAKLLGLKPIVVHFDNGWDSELAVNNIENITKKLGFDLYTYVINWNEFRDLQVSYFKASVVDIEVITDHAITATLFKIARKFHIKYILSGENTVTEGILPPNWVHNKSDFMNIRAIHKRFGKVKLKTYPHLTFLSRLFYSNIIRIESVKLLDYITYNKDIAKSVIKNELDWRDYGGKHYESIFTRFYQAYILPNKFKIDKRKSHLSTLICSGQITREQAIAEIALPIYDEKKLNEDKQYVLKKLGLSETEFENIMQLPIVKHTDYPSIMNIYKKLRIIKYQLKKLQFNFKKQ